MGKFVHTPKQLAEEAIAFPGNDMPIIHQLGEYLDAALQRNAALVTALEDMLETLEWKRKPYTSEQMTEFRRDAHAKARTALASNGGVDV